MRTIRGDSNTVSTPFVSAARGTRSRPPKTLRRILSCPLVELDAPSPRVRGRSWFIEGKMPKNSLRKSPKVIPFPQEDLPR